MEKASCPKCGNEMEKGYVYAERRLKWADNNKKVMTSYKDETILPFNFGWKHKKIIAYRCASCKVVTFEY